MTISMYQASVPVFMRMLTNCTGILAKAEAHAAAAGIDPAILLEARLAPDMFPLHRQVQIAADGPEARRHAWPGWPCPTRRRRISRCSTAASSTASGPAPSASRR